MKNHYIVAGLLLLFVQTQAQYFKVDYPPSADSNELRLGVTYTLWIPPGASFIRGIIVHQHGAGTTAARSGESGAYDLHWQALARKWDCALMVPSYHVLNDKTDASPGGAQLWFDPRLGSDKVFLRAIEDLSVNTGHAELKQAPWVLWGHSGGAIWSDVMMLLHPERVVAVWLRSGTEQMWHDRPGFTAMSVPQAVYGIPIMCNPGIQEKDNLIGKGQLTKFKMLRGAGAPAGIAFDPLTGHWTGNSRYLAIPYLDACMRLRLPDRGGLPLRPAGRGVMRWSDAVGDSVWLPDEKVARSWVEYVRTGLVSDSTPPPAPFDVQVKDIGEKGMEITWKAEADLESGIGHFIIFRDGQELGNCPAVNLVRFQVLPNFQAGWLNSYNDAPANPVPEMRFVDPWPKDNKPHIYTVVNVNTAGLRSRPSGEASSARLQTAALFDDGMVLQRGRQLSVWGWALPGDPVEVVFKGGRYHGVTGADGKWMIFLPPCAAGGPFDMSISAGMDTIRIRNILVGEVWLCSGQSNMVLDFNNEGVRRLYAADVAASANDQIRQLLVERDYRATPARSFKRGGWKSAGPQTLPAFSAAAYFFARTLYEKYHVPIGIINASYGGTVAQAWTSGEGLKELPVVEEKEPKNAPCVLFNAMIAPLVPYAIRGVAWYQGEYNTHRAFAYRQLFPALIRDWRSKWGDSVLPFIFQQLPNFQQPVTQPSENEWAELREAYGEKKILSSGPLYRGMRVGGNKIVLSFDNVGGGLVTKGGDSLTYFAVAGGDRKFVWAKAVIRGATVEVSAPGVDHPAAVRYAWAGNPEGCNLYNKEGLPASPFRTDDWPGLTVGN
ncbi:MAG: hypothetical protein J0H74_10190 [Chitinophagaceae bacterium]|nr:hypothetical protein [Chitinophagaceae bacterium]